jgi:heptosyltransferase-1
MNILIVRLSSLGDVVHNMPMVADILRFHPAAQIDWVVEENYASLVALNTGVRRVIPFALRRWRRSPGCAATRADFAAFRRSLREREYDVVLDTQGLIKSAVVMRMARLRPDGQRIGLANRTEGCGYEALSRVFHHYSVPVALRTHAVLRARLVAAWGLGYWPDTPADFRLAPPPPDRTAWLPQHPYAVFFHGTSRAAKQWPTADWIATGALLGERGMQVLLPWGTEEERRSAEAIAARISHATVLPRLPLMEAVLLAQRAALVIGVDTGLTHIAAAYCRPTIELYCDSARWNTQGDWSPDIINLGDAGSPPTAGDVGRAVERLMSAERRLPAHEATGQRRASTSSAR